MEIPSSRSPCSWFLNTHLYIIDPIYTLRKINATGNAERKPANVNGDKPWINDECLKQYKAYQNSQNLQWDEMGLG